MPEVIGFKGSPEERLSQWRILTMISSSLKWYLEQHSSRYSVAYNKEKRVYNLFLKDYIS